MVVGFVAVLVTLLGWTTGTAGNSPRLVAYYPGWNTNTYPYTMVDYSQMTHIAHAFMWPNADGSLNVTSDFRYNPPLVQAAHAHGVKIVISVGGSGAPDFPTMVNDPVARSNFVQKLTAFCVSNNYDGADYDWEAPADTGDKTNFTALVQQTRAAFNAVNPSWTLSAAVKPTSSSGQWLDVPALKTNLSWFGVMSYDFYGPWSATSGYEAPLYAAPGDPKGSTYCVNAAIQYYESRGVPLTNLFSGVNFGACQFTSTNVFASTNGPSVDIVYSNAVNDISNGWTRVWNTTAQVPSLADPSHTHVVTYEDPQSVQYKCDYTVGQRLGGTIVWVLNSDAYLGDTPLLNVLSSSLLGVTNINLLLDTFEGTNGHFSSTPTASPSTVGIATSSSASLTAAAAHSGTNSVVLVLKDDTTTTTNWAVRFLSNGGNPAGQANIGTNGYVGFWLKTTASSLSVGIAVDDTDGTERSVALPVVGNGQWYRYEWNLAGGASQWSAWSNGNGVVDGPQVTVDAIWFYAPNNSANMTVYLDDVYKRYPVSRVGAPVATAGPDQKVAASNDAFAVTLNGSASSSRLLQWLTYQWTQIAGPSVTLAHPTNLVANFTYTGVVYTNTDLQFQLAVDDGLFTSNDTTTVTLLPTDSVGDGIPDWWRQQYFGGGGTNTNSVACTLCDADGSGQNNLFKYVAGLDPTNPASVFVLQIAATNQPGMMNLMFSPVAAGRTYTVQSNADAVNGTYSDLAGFAGPQTNNANNQVTITDTSANTSNEFYRLHISLP